MEASTIHAPAGLARIRLAPALLRLRTDEQLVVLFRAGSEEAFRTIHDRYRQRLFAYARQMLAGSRQDAEDALQDVFVRAYGGLRAHNRPVTLRAWLYRIAHNRCVDEMRRPEIAPADVLAVSRGPLHDPLEIAERRDDLRRLVDDVQRLPTQQRSALLMREIDGLSYDELASALEVTIPAVKSLLVRARMGLVEAREARDAACVEIRDDLCLSFGRGVRASGRARRHMRDCPDCQAYRVELRRTKRALAAILPAGAGPLSLLGLGGGGGAGAAGAASAAGGGGAATGGGAILSGATLGGAGAATKVAAVVCSAVVGAGGAVEVSHTMAQRATVPTTLSAAPANHGQAASAADAPKLDHVAALRTADVGAAEPVPAVAKISLPPAPIGDADSAPTGFVATTDAAVTGGALAPADDAADPATDSAGPGTAPVDTPADEPPGTSTDPVTGAPDDDTAQAAAPTATENPSSGAAPSGEGRSSSFATNSAGR
jgi:RNA polymerase sigma factor (sigma-70 family)